MTSAWKPGPQVQAIPTQAHRGGGRPTGIANSAPSVPSPIMNYTPASQSNTITAQFIQFSPPPGPNNYTDLEILYSPNNTLPPRRETGIIEKLLQNFGFVQCCDRQARLFFHFSQYSGNIDDLKNGDEVEFEAGVDRRTGKPIALNIYKHNRQPSIEHVSDKRYVGEVTYAPKHNTIIKPGSSPQTELGRLSYENKGEWYFLSFTPLDVSGDLMALKQGDKVSFRISTDARTSSIKAREVRLEESAAAPKHQGVVCSLKDNFGFVERADCVKEIFFHFSEFMGEISNISVGDDVEFEIHTRNNKEVATSVFQLPAGTVQFEDVRPETRKGLIVRPIPRTPGKKPNPDDPLPARLKYKDEHEGECEIVFGDRDQNGEYTLLNGDHVTFNLAIDKRDALKRATNVTLLEESLRNSGERREKGTVATLKDGFGFVNCHEKGVRLFFHFSEILDQKAHIKLNDEVEFSIITTDSPDKQNAVRLKIVGSGNASRVRKPNISKPPLLASTLTNCASPQSHQNPITVSTLADGETVTKGRGFVSWIRHSIGFIESEDHCNEYMFQISDCALPPDAALEPGDEVEFLLRVNGDKKTVDNIQLLERGTIQSMVYGTEVLVGEVSRALHTANEADQQGLIKEKIQDLYTGRQFRFGAFSMLWSRHQDFQVSDLVEFKIGTVTKTDEKRAVEIKPLRQRIKSKVSCVKGEDQLVDDNFGFINHETPENKQLFFRQSEVADGVRLKANDEVEFEVTRNVKTNKLSASNVKRISTTANSTIERSTDRLSHRVRTISLNNPETKVAIIREPYTSDGSRGFQYQRTTTEPTKRPFDFDDEEDDLFSNNLDDDICGEDGSGDYNRDEEKAGRLDDKIKSCGDS